MEPIFDNTEFRKEFRKNERVRDAAPEMLKALKAIRDYEPCEVCKDDFAYDRMVEAYRTAARDAIAVVGGEEGI